jgi:DNA-binding winged helix-turn-helix (wHTH) protein
MRLFFDGFEIDREACQLFRDGLVVPLEPRVFDLLCYFVAHPKRVILKDELLMQVWQARSLSDGVLANALTKLRKALGQPPDAREPLETVRGRGYYFHATPRGPTHETSVPPGAVPNDQFVGRGYVLAQLMAALDRAASGSGQLLVVAGESGIGKTRAVSEFSRLAEARGYRCWWGAVCDGDVAPAYWPWIEVLRAAHQQLSPTEWQRVLPASRAALAQLVPELGASSASPSADAQTLRFKVFEEVTWLLRCAAREAPRVVILDDLHAADLATIDLLASVSRALGRSPVLFIAAVREPAGTIDAQRAAALARLTRNAQRLELQGLSHDEVAELAGTRQHSTRDDSRLITTLCERTQGNPLFVCQLLAMLEQRGALSEVGLRSLTAADLPPAIHGVIQERIRALEESSRGVLSVAAVAGVEFDADLIAAALGDSVEHVLSALQPALELRVVDLRSSAPRRFAFAHVMLRDSLAATLGIAQLGRVHGQLAQAQLARGVAGDPRRLAEVARHLLAAVPSQLEASSLYCQAAAEAARRSSGFEVAAELLSRLVQKHEDEGGEPLTRCELLLTLAVDQLCSGAVMAAWKTLQRGAELAGALNAASMLARIALQLSAWGEFGGGDESYVRSIVARALDSLADTETDLRAGLLALRARLEQDRPFAEREALLDEAERLAERRATLEVQRRIALDRVLTSDPVSLSTRRAAQRFRELDAQQRATHADPIRLQQTFWVEWHELVDALTAGELACVDAATARCRALAHGAKIMLLDFQMLLVDAGRAHGTGNLDELERLVQRLADHGSIEGSLGAAWMAYAMLLAYERGALPPWVDDPQARQQMWSRFAQRQRVHAVVWGAWLAAQTGAPHAAAQLLAELGPAAFSHMPRQRGDLCSLCALAETYALIGDRSGAAQLMPQLEPFAASYAVGFACEWRGAVAHYLGLLAALLGDSASASAHFTHAEALHEEARMPLHLARTRAERARLLR